MNKILFAILGLTAITKGVKLSHNLEIEVEAYAMADAIADAISDVVAEAVADA